jgi:hypothetical protein
LLRRWTAQSILATDKEHVVRQDFTCGLTIELSGHINREAIDWSA